MRLEVWSWASKTDKNKIFKNKNLYFKWLQIFDSKFMFWSFPHALYFLFSLISLFEEMTQAILWEKAFSGKKLWDEHNPYHQ